MSNKLPDEVLLSLVLGHARNKNSAVTDEYACRYRDDPQFKQRADALCRFLRVDEDNPGGLRLIGAYRDWADTGQYKDMLRRLFKEEVSFSIEFTGTVEKPDPLNPTLRLPWP